MNNTKRERRKDEWKAKIRVTKGAEKIVKCGESIYKKKNTEIETAPLARAVEYLPRNECPGYDTKQSNDETPVILEL